MPSVTPVAHSSPLTLARTVSWSSGGRSGSPIVVIHGPIPNAKSLHFCGPIPMPISRAWMSRAEKSLKIVRPKSRSSAWSGVRLRPVPPTTRPSSSS